MTDCQRFKKGKYFFYSRTLGVRIDIDRDSTHQTQYNPLTDTLTGYNIKWTGDCEYEVFKTYTTKKHITDASEMRAFMDLGNVVLTKFKIIESAKDYYIFESWKEGSNLISKDTLWLQKSIGGVKSMGDIFKTESEKI